MYGRPGFQLFCPLTPRRLREISPGTSLVASFVGAPRPVVLARWRHPATCRAISGPVFVRSNRHHQRSWRSVVNRFGNPEEGQCRSGRLPFTYYTIAPHEIQNHTFRNEFDAAWYVNGRQRAVLDGRRRTAREAEVCPRSYKARRAWLGKEDGKARSVGSRGDSGTARKHGSAGCRDGRPGGDPALFAPCR
jgi:hypothetical protein